jgi:hypothetical protein
VLKEADLRIRFTDVFRSATSFASLDRASALMKSGLFRSFGAANAKKQNGRKMF